MSLIQSINLTKPTDGRRFAISDVHGCYYTFKALIEQLRLDKSDQVFLVGDMVNRGPYSDKVLDHIIHLQQEGFQLYLIRGNHEQAILNTVKKSSGQRKVALKSYNSLSLLDENNIKTSYQKLLEASYHYIELDQFFLVHAGFNPKKSLCFSDTFSMMNIRHFKAKKKALKGKAIIIGHTPTDLTVINDRIKREKKKICIDNGCVNDRVLNQGNLICLDLDRWSIIVQHNIEQKKEGN